MNEDFIPQPILDRLRRLNAIFDFAMNSCDVPFTVMVASIPGAAVKPLIMLLSFGLDDVVRGLLRPKGLYRHSPMGKGAQMLSKAFPEIGEAIGKQIGNHSTLAQELQVAGGKGVWRNLWILDGLAQRVLFYFLLADVLLELGSGIIKGIKSQGFCATEKQRRALQRNGVYRQTNVVGFWLVNPTTTYVFGWNKIGDLEYRHAQYLTKTSYTRATYGATVTCPADSIAWRIRFSIGIRNSFKNRTVAREQTLAITPGGTVRMNIGVSGRGNFITAAMEFTPLEPVPPAPPTVTMFEINLSHMAIQEAGLGTLT